ncbi:hypothetical protein BDP27DRAFT_1348370 [Rhodocollybia butyracea]|uniref:Uncharacterized protein n=1 Tax=Rhodocollybia butyracea TaxID=206335 RepID=A0A9P5TWA7_9AGAR|nr:hypothetical protein BDP27DRAFT_1348370 [Rhodocollybia butyracea]
MRTVATFATLATVVTAALAAVTISKRQGPTFYLVVCTEPELASDTCHVVGGLNTCNVFPTGFDNSIESLGSTSFTNVSCTVYVNDDCTGNSLVVEPFQEYPNLAASNPDLNNALSSYECKAF